MITPHPNYPLIAFVVIVLLLTGLLTFFLRGALFSLSGLAASHARTYAVSYIKGGALIMIAAVAGFESAYWALDEPLRATMTWVPYAIFFSKPFTAGLAVLVAFLDRSTQRAGEEEKEEKIRTSNTPKPFQELPKP